MRKHFVNIICLIYMLEFYSFVDTSNNLRDAENLENSRKFLNEMGNQKKKSWINPYDLFADEVLPDNAESSSLELTQFSDENLRTAELSDDHSFQDKEDITPPSTETLAEVTKINPDIIFLVRWLKIIHEKLNQKKIFESDETKTITFTLTKTVVDQMNEIIISKVPKLEDIEELLTNSITNLNVANDVIVISYISSLFQQEVIWFMVILVVAIYLVIVVFKSLKTFFMVLFTSSFCWHWMKLYKQSMAAKYARLEFTDIPAVCYSKNMSVMDSIKGYFKSWFVSLGDCEKYHEAIFVDPMWDVSPSTALADTLSIFLLTPLQVLSHTLNKCVKELLSDLPIWSQILVIFLFIWFLLLFFGYRLRFPFYLGALEPSDTPGLFRILSGALQNQSLVQPMQNVHTSDRVSLQQMSQNQSIASQVIQSTLQFPLKETTSSCDDVNLGRRGKQNSFSTHKDAEETSCNNSKISNKQELHTGIPYVTKDCDPQSDTVVDNVECNVIESKNSKKQSNGSKHDYQINFCTVEGSFEKSDIEHTINSLSEIKKERLSKQKLKPKNLSKLIEE